MSTPIWILQRRSDNRILCNDGRLRQYPDWGGGSDCIKEYRSKGWALRKLESLGHSPSGPGGLRESRFIAIALYPGDRLGPQNEVIRAEAEAWQSVRPGERIKFLVPNGRTRAGQVWRRKTGRVVMRGPAGLVVNGGGAHGTPHVVNSENYLGRV